MRKIHTTITAIATMAVLASCSGNKGGQAEAEAPLLQTMKVSTQSADLQSVYPVTIKGQEDVEIRPRVDGFIKEIFVDEGSVVRQGQVLFTIDSPTTESNLRTAQAAVASAQAQANTAKLNVDRIRPLAEKNIISGVNVQTAENTYQAAQAALAQAQATLANAKVARSWASVTSPVNGVVGTINYRKGSLVSSAYAVTTVANISNVFAEFSLNEKEVASLLATLPGNTQAEKLKSLPPVTLVLADGTEYGEKGRIETVSGVVNAITGSANLRAEFPNQQGVLRSGASGKIIIPQKEENTIVIPQSATFARQDKVLVYKVQADSVVQTVVEVKALPDGKNYAVSSGLKSGEKIVTEGILTLSQGMKIKEKK